jgi:hypothetical protein
MTRNLSGRIAGLVTVLGVVLLVGFASPASALGSDSDSVTDDRVSLSVGLGYGFRVTEEGDLDQDANPYGLGIGARGGYTFPGGFYLGGLFNYYVGENVGGDTVNGRISQFNLAGDVGGDLTLARAVILRPVLGIGATVVTGEICTLGQCAEDQTDPYLLLAPGLHLIIGVGSFFVGGEARYYYLPDDEIPDGMFFGANIGGLL